MFGFLNSLSNSEQNEKKNFWNRLKKNSNFQAAITFEPIDVETSDKVFWASQIPYYKIPVEIPNRGGGSKGSFPQGRKNQTFGYFASSTQKNYCV